MVDELAEIVSWADYLDHTARPSCADSGMSVVEKGPLHVVHANEWRKLRYVGAGAGFLNPWAPGT